MHYMTNVTPNNDKSHLLPQMHLDKIRRHVQNFTNGISNMTELLTAKEMEKLLQVDRSTIYRMAENGRLPAIKVGKQWRFPADQVTDLFHIEIPVQTNNDDLDEPPFEEENTEGLATILPLECVQLIQESFADLLGVMIVVTDLEGQPITEVSNACGLFAAISQVPSAVQKCTEDWRSMATSLELEPRFRRSHLGLLCARALIRVGSELKGMVIASCVAPEYWPPITEEAEEIAVRLGVEVSLIEEHMDEVHRLSTAGQERVLSHVQKIANVVAHIVNERKTFVNRLEAIADLTAI
jgi:excisionase family DNA binding protein